MILPVRRYADFRGRSGRCEFWSYCLFLFLGYLALFSAGIAAAMASEGEADALIALLTVGGPILFFLMNFLAGLALTARRLHDMGISGALLIAIFFAMLFLSLLAWPGYMLWMSLPGQAKTNRWGPPPGAADAAEVFT